MKPALRSDDGRADKGSRDLKSPEVQAAVEGGHSGTTPCHRPPMVPAVSFQGVQR